MLLANAVSPVNAVAKEICAAGARSWTICAIARPSSAPPVPGSASTATGVVRPRPGHGLPAPGMSPDAMS